MVSKQTILYFISESPGPAGPVALLILDHVFGPKAHPKPTPATLRRVRLAPSSRPDWRDFSAPQYLERIESSRSSKFLVGSEGVEVGSVGVEGRYRIGKAKLSA